MAILARIFRWEFGLTEGGGSNTPLEVFLSFIFLEIIPTSYIIALCLVNPCWTKAVIGGGSLAVLSCSYLLYVKVLNKTESILDRSISYVVWVMPVMLILAALATIVDMRWGLYFYYVSLQ